ncbi:Peroxisomal 2,4-dienoyl-CoA reductase, putative [Theobroma cacao]|uniref:2,4-dienoyl-CoA reductase [(3E)-enoyl-CoA-producing] n=1 Tax=Theobroma cacao TaxID=3641 RepID=A0A061E3P2_THECC|nr:Peroxisomal 2,4-dienoyl-CoA reductase, putative [Theobroma cacao]
MPDGSGRMCHNVVKYLKKGGPGKDPSTGGAIINMRAVCIMEGHGTKLMRLPPSFRMLSFHQAAVDSITRNLALEWGTDHDIRVNGIAPGAIDDTAVVTKLAPEEMLSKIKEKPLYKFGEK